MAEISSEQRIAALRQLQHAANMLSARQFAAALGLEWDAADNYAKDKYADFRVLGRLHVFSDSTLSTLMDFYLAHYPQPPAPQLSEREQKIADLARSQQEDGHIEFDAITAEDISEGDSDEDNGCYVRGWLWVDFSGSELDKDADDN